MIINIFIRFFILSFILTNILLLIFIPILRKIKLGQNIRKEGPKKHLKKQGTPTMGGLAIAISVVALYLIMAKIYKYQQVILIIAPLLTYLLIGIIDDYLIVIKHNNQGLTVKTKLIMQTIGALIYYLLYRKAGLSTTIYLFKHTYELKNFYFIVILLMFVATTNAVNLSDGMDGLAAGLTIISLITIAIISYIMKNYEILSFTIILVASLMAFFIYNANPAQIFMGNTGSLFLGAVLANLMILLKLELFLIIIALVFVLETLSVIIQVIYFKITKGKRLFLMSPVHHHFELKGLNEWQVDILFWIIALISSILGLFLIL